MSILGLASPALDQDFTRIPCLIKHGIWVKSGVGSIRVIGLSDTQRVLGSNLRFDLGFVACLAGFAGATGFNYLIVILRSRWPRCLAAAL